MKPARKTKPARSKTAPVRRPVAMVAPFHSSNNSDARTNLYLASPRDLRKDLTPSARKEMMARMRHGERNFGLYRQIVQDVVSYTTPRRPVSHASKREVAREHVRYFMEWARRCDVTERFSYWDIQRLEKRRKWVDGDVFIAVVRDASKGIRLQVLEAHRVCDSGKPLASGKRSDDGVIYDRAGRVLAYSVQLDDGTYEEVDAANIIHIFSPEWTSGSRGIPRLQHSWADMQDYAESLALEKQAVKLHSEYSIIFKTANGTFSGLPTQELNQDGDSSCPAEVQDLVQDISGGKLIAAPVGSDVDLKSSMRPNANLVTYLDAMKRDITMSAVPYEFTADSSKLGSVGIRLVGAKASRLFVSEMDESIAAMDSKIWALVIGDGINRGLIPEDDNFEMASWMGPKDVTVDAGREAANDRNNIASGLMSFSEYYRINSGDFEAESETLAQNYRHMYDLEDKYGLPRGVLTEGLRKGSTAQPVPAEPANVAPSSASTNDSNDNTQ